MQIVAQFGLKSALCSVIPTGVEESLTIIFGPDRRLLQEMSRWTRREKIMLSVRCFRGANPHLDPLPEGEETWRRFPTRRSLD